MFNDVQIFNYQLYDDRKVVYYKHFRDLNDFLESVLNENINPIFSRKSSSNNDYEFSKTNSYKEAWNLCRFTMNEGFDTFYSLFRSLNYSFSNSLKIVNSFSTVGYTPSVPRYLKGIPTSMYCYREEYTDKVVNIYINSAYSANQNHNEIINRGVLILNLVNYLENQNIKVNILMYDLSETDKEIVCLEIPIKTKDEKLNIKKCYFPLVHPSFLRRLGFRAMELMPVKDKNWNFGYGTPIKYQRAINLLEQINSQKTLSNQHVKSIYISTPNELGIDGKDIYRDCDNFIKNINAKYQLFDDLDKERRR